MPGSVVSFSLIKGETKEGDDLPQTSLPAELFNRCVSPPVGLGCPLETPQVIPFWSLYLQTHLSGAEFSWCV